MAPTASKWLEQILHTQNGYPKYTDLKIWRLLYPNHPPSSLGKIRKESWKTTTLCDEYELLLQHLKDILFFFALLYTLQRFFLKENSEWGQLKKKYHCCWVECRQFLSGFFSMKNEQRIKSKTWRHWPVKSTVFCCNVMSLFLKQM